MSDNWDEKAVFLMALELAPADRTAFLEGACPNEDARARVEDLIRIHEADRVEQETAAASPEDEELGDLREIDEFRLIRRLGRGGMGVVYLAEDTVLGRRVALKLLSEESAGEGVALARFREEARHTASLTHPAIVPVYKLGFDGRKHYIVSEYVEGTTLSALIESEATRRMRDPSPAASQRWLQRCATIAAAVADALEHSHRAGIVHRDVKPSNILLDGGGAARLADFGIAKQLSHEPRTQTGVVGSYHYMSPEQASLTRARIDGRSDIFSMGVVLYQMFSLRRPFDGGDPRVVMKAVIEQEPPRLRSVDRRIPTDLETICHRAIEKRPVDRYQSAAQVAADLRSFLVGDPILASPTTIRRRVARWAWRRRRRVAMTMLLLFIGMAALAFEWQRRALRDERRAAVAWVSLDTGREPCDVWIQAHDAKTLRLRHARRRVDDLRSGKLYLEPGQYRLTVERREDGAFCEFNLVLLRRGSGQTTIVRVVDARDELIQDIGENELVGVFRPTKETTKEGMIRISEGVYALRGRSTDNAMLQGSVQLSAFWIDATEVSNREYQEFVDATGHRSPFFWKLVEDFDEIADLPVIWLTLQDAEAYARWRGKRLPTFWEWQAAARGPSGNLYPDGDIPPSARAPTPFDTTLISAESIYAAYRSGVVPTRGRAVWDPPNGPWHMFSNVSELAGTVDIEDTDVFRMGRDWRNPIDKCDLRYFTTAKLHVPAPSTGFRCAKSVFLSGPEEY